MVRRSGPRERFVYRARGEAVHSARGGPIRAVLRSYSPLLSSRPRRAANSIVRMALERAGRWWIAGPLPRRFSAYARKLGYKSAKDGGKVIATVDGHAIRVGAPFVDSGEFAIAAISGARVRATATANRQRVRITVPQPHPMRAKTVAQFRTVPREEVEAMAREFEAALGEALGAATAAGHSARVAP